MIRVELTSEQIEVLTPLFKQVHDLNEQGINCAIVAQIYEDGLVAKVIKGQEGQALADALGGHWQNYDNSSWDRVASKQ